MSLTIFLWLVYFFFRVGLSSLSLSCFDWDFTLGVFLWQNDWSLLRKGKGLLWGINVLFLKALFCSTHRTLGILLGNHIPSQSLSWCGSFQYREPGSATNSSHLPLSLLFWITSAVMERTFKKKISYLNQISFPEWRGQSGEGELCAAMSVWGINFLYQSTA